METNTKANAAAEIWKRSEAAYHEQRRAENRRAWADFHLAQAGALEQTAAVLAARHRARAAELIERGEVHDAAS